MSEITPELLSAHRLTPDEYQNILRILGREPTLTELGIFSVMWSEHCSYKSSRLHLKKLPTRSPRILQGPGENAGVIDIGGGWAIAFKIESHNHPSFIEPFQGAATGVGGILRDIFTMGARPIAVMDALRFGPPTDPDAGARNAHIVEGVVSGIAHYGNCFGVPTVGGETMFEACYNGNPLVNVFALGIVEPGKIFYGKAHGPGNPVIYVGAKTGRDGIHGASMASAEFDEDSSQKRPNVQVGDPFMEKLLLEACLEAMGTGAIVGIQDMGAAGLTSSSTEMSSRAGTGIEIDLDRVPQRETGMTAYEIMLSESQERMLLVAEKGREKEVLDVFEKWGLDAAIIGVVTDTGLTVVRHRGEVAATIPSRRLADEAPLYDRPQTQPYRTHPLERAAPIPASPDLEGDLRKLLGSLDLCSKRWIWEQYDYMVRTNTLTAPEDTDAAVLRIKETGNSVAMSLDGNGRYCYLDPREGTKLIVAECCLNLSTVGAFPVATTNNLNFGNPERPEIMAQIVESIEGMAEACAAFEAPVTGGNVSLYNETLGTPIFPTPVVGIVGLMEGQGRHASIPFKRPDLSVLLLGGLAPCDDVRFGSSQYAKVILEDLWGLPPALDLKWHKRAQAAIRQIVAAGLADSAHDVGDGGLAVALAECAFEHGIGAVLELDSDLRPEFLLFGEAPGRVLVSSPTPERIQQLAGEHGVTVLEIGKTVADRLEIRSQGVSLISTTIDSLKNVWSTAFEQHLEKHAALVTATADESCRS
jgi:phosphoribosylformylglycinamidine synthase